MVQITIPQRTIAVVRLTTKVNTTILQTAFFQLTAFDRLI
nr:MAG TPA: hypothetical protein [Caudoviricetes sp.]DAL76391.1 MAG TPA: hypothetical protein [Caudoviricetes sp.]